MRCLNLLRTPYPIFIHLGFTKFLIQKSKQFQAKNIQSSAMKTVNNALVRFKYKIQPRSTTTNSGGVKTQQAT